MTSPFYEDARNGVAIYCGDCLDVLPTMPDSSVDLILTDPPFYKVKDEGWDNQWATPTDFLAWLDRVLVEFARILKPNGSLYLFASPQMGARVECLIAGRFEVLNSITWRKPPFSTKAEMNTKEDQRIFFPSSERIIFAEPFGADSAAKGEAGYEQKCDQMRGQIFEPLRKYLDDERIAAGLDKIAINVACGFSASPGGMASRHYFSRSQWWLPTPEHYAAIQALAPSHFRREYKALRDEYETLHVQYEELRKEYEELRRPFTVSSKVPYTDVWDFETVGNHPGKHICEKPMPLLRHMISASSRPGAVVLDAFGGSCSTADAANQLGRRSITIERDEKWCRRGAARLSQEVLPFLK